jgi:glycerophosphoryl diester phosphodiesterase
MVLKTFLRPLPAVLHDIRVSWRELALTDITYKLLAFMLLTPIVSILFHVLVAQTGETAITDEDILQFVLEPLGWVCAVLVGALSIAIIALEQVALMSIVCAADHGRHLSVRGALRWAAVSAWPVLHVAARIVICTLLALTPFLAAAGWVYWALLTEFDINYYLKEKPPAFWIAAGCGGVISLGIAAVLLRLATSWFYALPLVCFEAVPPRRALRVSGDRVTGHRHMVVLWVVVWLVVTLLLSALATGSVVFVAERLVPRATGSLGLLLFAVGTTLIVWSGVHIVINLLTTTSFAAIFFRLYRDLGTRRELDVERLLASADRPRRPAFVLTRKRLVAALVVGTILATAVGVFAIHNVRTTDRCEVVAHRGAAGSAPENTMAAVRQAVQEQADWVEIDVQETADGEVVVFHDSDFMKLAGRDLNIWNATRADLLEIDIGSWFNADYRAERVPTLAEVLAYCQGKVRVIIELKYYGHDQNLARRVAEIVEAHDMQSNIVTMSLNRQLIDKMKSLRPDWPAGLLAAVAVGDLTQVRADFLAVKATIATRAFVRSAHNRQKKVLAWTVNDPVTMSTLIGRGVDGIITDKPALARKVLTQRAGLSSVERLLIKLAGLLGVTPQIAEQ